MFRNSTYLVTMATGRRSAAGIDDAAGGWLSCWVDCRAGAAGADGTCAAFVAQVRTEQQRCLLIQTGDFTWCLLTIHGKLRRQNCDYRIHLRSNWYLNTGHCRVGPAPGTNRSQDSFVIKESEWHYELIWEYTSVFCGFGTHMMPVKFVYGIYALWKALLSILCRFLEIRPCGTSNFSLCNPILCCMEFPLTHEYVSCYIFWKIKVHRVVKAYVLSRILNKRCS